ncbi:sugar O-acetyltransferase [Lacticaseibacillus daqingensis]|uniref:sugar O-acetyltransferase n=1 Tax=Lacticaseibacillus daqingensis TaxID=2486014 RepID=UPI001CDBC916|nr:sugar O-acetyltransferase [Lacticaseibacillus daqingensis]
MNPMDQLSSGALYRPSDPALVTEQLKWQDLLVQYNQTLPSEQTKRSAMLQQLFGAIGPDCYIEAPMHANWGGHHAHFGRHIYANYNLTMVDDGPIYVGDNTMFGPNVVLATAGHPVWPALRPLDYQYNMAIHIGQNCWFGAGAIVLPGVTIGDNVVVGAGSVVTHDLPANVVAVGNPCRVLRAVNQHDREFYFKDRRIDWAAIAAESGETFE